MDEVTELIQDERGLTRRRTRLSDASGRRSVSPRPLVDGRASPRPPSSLGAGASGVARRAGGATSATELASMAAGAARRAGVQHAARLRSRQCCHSTGADQALHSGAAACAADTDARSAQLLVQTLILARAAMRTEPHFAQVAPMAYSLLVEICNHCDVTLAHKQLKARPTYATRLRPETACRPLEQRSSAARARRTSVRVHSVFQIELPPPPAGAAARAERPARAVQRDRRRLARAHRQGAAQGAFDALAELELRRSSTRTTSCVASATSPATRRRPYVLRPPRSGCSRRACAGTASTASTRSARYSCRPRISTCSEAL